MHKWLMFLVAYLLGSFFGIGQVLGLVRGVTTPKAASSVA